MAFNWAGAAGGMQDALQEQIKLDLARQQQYDMSEYRKLNQQIAQQNADSLKDEREARIAAADAKRQSIEQRRRWAEGVGQEGPVAEGDWRTALDRARAQHILATGEDLPDTAISTIMSSYMKAPPQRVSKLLTPEEEAQAIRLDKTKRQNAAKFRPPSAAAGIRAERQQGDVAVQNYLAYLKQKHGANAQAALAEFDTSGDVIRKGRGLVDTGQYRRLLERMYGLPSTPYTPKQAYENKLYNELLADEAATAVDGEDDDTSGR